METIPPWPLCSGDLGPILDRDFEELLPGHDHRLASPVATDYRVSAQDQAAVEVAQDLLANTEAADDEEGEEEGEQGRRDGEVTGESHVK